MMRSFLNVETSDTPYRTEAVPWQENWADKVRLSIGEEYWIGYSLFLPDDQPYDTQIVFQLHGEPDWDLGECWRPPIFSLDIEDRGGRDRAELVTWSDARPNTCPDGTNDGIIWRMIDLGRPPTGQWMDIVLHLRLGYEAAQNPFTEIWIDGEYVARQDEPNCYNDQVAPYAKLGIYHYSWNSDPAVGDRIVYHDELRIGDSSASYDDVVPR